MISLTIVCHCLNNPSCCSSHNSCIDQPRGQNNGAFDGDNRPDPGIGKFVNESGNKHFLCRAEVTVYPSLQILSSLLALLQNCIFQPVFLISISKLPYLLRLNLSLVWRSTHAEYVETISSD